MPSTEELIQRTIHAAEVGRHAVWWRRSLVLAAAAGLCVFHLLHGFRGLATSQGMEQAQIGRELARGHGWSTKMARPLAIGELRNRGKDASHAAWLDTYHAPLPPLLDAVALLKVKEHWKMTKGEVVYAGDRAIAIMSVGFFLCSVGVLYLIACRLFDRHLAWLACGLVLVCDAMWQYALSGLPQMLLLLVLHLTVYALIRALEAREAARTPRRWLATASIGFGLLALAHAMTLWLCLPAVLFCACCFRPLGRTAALMLGIVALMVAPWLVRNHAVSGNPFGLGIYSIFDGIGASEAGHMRRLKPDFASVAPAEFRGKLRNNVISQFDRIFEYMGWSCVAPLAAVSLLHAFRRRETASLRWLLLAMWTGAVLGMAVFGLREEQGLAANQFHLLFVPLLTCYGLAFLLVQWNRLDFRHRYFRASFLGLLFLLCGLPTISTLISARPARIIRWPPYLPVYIASLADWMQPEEIIASDMPWAVAWYADRRSVWVPETVKAFTDLHDFRTLGGPVNGLYLTPVSGSENKLGDLLTGEYSGWTSLIVRIGTPPNFPLPWSVIHGFDECIFYSDRDRRIRR